MGRKRKIERKFGKKQYLWHSMHKTKTRAKKEATKIRKRGDLARVTPSIRRTLSGRISRRYEVWEYP